MRYPRKAGQAAHHSALACRVASALDGEETEYSLDFCLKVDLGSLLIVSSRELALEGHMATSVQMNTYSVF